MKELDFLKAQVNPHFLLNAINSIYSLIDEDQELASETLLKFAGLLRYQLYDCASEYTPLKREAEFLNDYIGLEMLCKKKNLTVIFDGNINDNYALIAPSILIPFVENAFKHRSHFDRGNYINITAGIDGNMLKFSVTNTYNEHSIVNAVKEHCGIGLKNVYRRLELLYDNRYRLQVKKAHGIYSVNLELELIGNKMDVRIAI